MDNWRSGGTRAEGEVGLSTLYLLGTDFRRVPWTITKKRILHWEIFDDGPHSLNRARVRELARAGRKQGVTYLVHGPICDLNPATLNPELRSIVMKRLATSLENAASLDAETWVLHPGTHGALSWVLPGIDRQVNLRSLQQLARLGRKLKVKVAIENISSGLAILGRVGDFRELYGDWTGVPDMALDLGHSHIKGETEAYLNRLGSHIVHVHAQDNKGDFDKHLAVGKGTVPWARVLRSLNKIGFKGRIIVESTSGPYSSLSKIQKLWRSLQ